MRYVGDLLWLSQRGLFPRLLFRADTRVQLEALQNLEQRAHDNRPLTKIDRLERPLSTLVACIHEAEGARCPVQRHQEHPAVTGPAQIVLDLGKILRAVHCQRSGAQILHLEHDRILAAMFGRQQVASPETVLRCQSVGAAWGHQIKSSLGTVDLFEKPKKHLLE
jgi:hypothetical protein